MPNLEFRRPDPDELREVLRVPLRSYGAHGSDAEVDLGLLTNEADRSIGVFDGERCVAGSGAYSFELTMPGGAPVGAAGITMVGLEPTHRRRGILTEMLRRLHADARDRGEPVALLTASETSIYRRFGYGITADVAHLAIDADAVRWDPPVEDPGRFEAVNPHVDTAELAAVHDRVRRARTGWLDLPEGVWAQLRRDPSFLRAGRTPLRGVLHRDAEGVADGYALWRIRAREDPDRLAANTAYLEHLTATTPDVEALLWGFVASIDLVTTVEFEVGPVDPAVRWRLVEPRQLRTLAVADMVWGRLLDVEAALSARSYGAAGTLDLEVTDRFHPEVGGRFRVHSPGRGTQGRCERVEAGATADGVATVALDIADATSIALGGAAPSTLAAAGRLRGEPSAVDLADALFALAERPWWPHEF